MNIFRLAFELFALYLLYKLVFDVILPMAKTTKEVKKQFSEMSRKMQEKQQQSAYPPQSANFQAPPKTNDSDYIDFEEVK